MSIGKNYGGYFTIKYIKIYLFYENNKKFKIIHKIIFPGNFTHDVIFTFSFINNNGLYFFLKYFSYDNRKITLYKLNEPNKLLDNNNEINIDKIFEENEILSFDFSFIWFAQKNNNELLFFKEEEDIFDWMACDFEEKKATNHKKINLVKNE